MTDQTPLAVATTWFDALGRGDVPSAFAALSPTVTWHQPGANRFSGEHVGPDAIGAIMGGVMQVSDGTFALAVTGPLMVNGDLVAAPVRFTGRRDGGPDLDMAGVDLLTIRGGKIVEVQLFSEDGRAEDAFWGTPGGDA